MTPETESHAPSKLVSVIIPIYTLDMTPRERAALRQALTVLKAHDIVVVTPVGLDLSSLPGWLGMDACWRQECFAESFFAGREGYNRLMTSAEFYERFLDSEFVLVCQTDVWIFSDSLREWCQTGYDYIGAPWLPNPKAVKGFYPIHRLEFLIKRLCHSYSTSLKYKVGNGGFSLRRTGKFAELARRHAAEIASLRQNEHGIKSFEDVIWSKAVNEWQPGALLIAPWDVALRFSVEGHVGYALSLLEGDLPMGTHAYSRFKNRGHWQGHIPPEAF